MDPNLLVRTFLGLTRSTKIKIANDLRLSRSNDGVLDDDIRWFEIFKRAQKENKLEQLWDLVQKKKRL